MAQMREHLGDSEQNPVCCQGRDGPVLLMGSSEPSTPAAEAVLSARFRSGCFTPVTASGGPVPVCPR